MNRSGAFIVLGCGLHFCLVIVRVMVLTNKLNPTQGLKVGQTGEILNGKSMVEMLDEQHLVCSEIFVFEQQYIDKKRQ